MYYKALGREEIFTEEDIVYDEYGDYISGCDNYHEAHICECCGNGFVPYYEGGEEFCFDCLEEAILEHEQDFREFAEIDADEPLREFIEANYDCAEDFVNSL